MLRLYCAIVVGKTISYLTSFTMGGGTAAPGYYALKLDPKLVRKLSTKLVKGTILVAGTNGKTTTSRMIAAMLKEANISYIHNREGSNLLRGIASTLIVNTSLTGNIVRAMRENYDSKELLTNRSKNTADYAIWEVDEATLPTLLHEVTPQIIVLTNLFRDQLDRYGEVNKIRTIWAHALSQLSDQTTIVLNADDPSIAHLGHNLQARVLYYGLDHDTQQETVSGSADANFCAVCQNPLSYDAIYFSHVGKYKCHKCGFERPQPSIEARDIATSAGSTRAIVHVENGGFGITVNLPGLYNLYNALAAASVGLLLKIPKISIIAVLKHFSAVFGRVETIAIGDKTLKLFLVKNPTGFNEVIHTLCPPDATLEPEGMLKQVQHDNTPATTYSQKSSAYNLQPTTFLIGINDNFADGTDISWLWDVDFEKLARHANHITATGIRAYDLANRLKYAGYESELTTEPAIDKAIDQFIASETKELTILPTYTVMLSLRKYLVEKGYIKHYLKEM